MAAGPFSERTPTGVKHAEDNSVPPATASKRSSLSWVVFLTAASGILAYFMAPKRITSPTLPETYALCSRQRNGVYTVDQHNSQTQCIVIQGAYIVETGSLGEPCYLIFPNLF